MRSKLIIFFVAVLCICVIYSGIASDSKDVAFLFKTTGKIQIQLANSRSWTNAKRGSRLNSGDKIQTGDRSMAALLFTDDKSLMKVRARSNLTIQGERQQKTIAKRVYMEIGQVFLNVKKRNSVFRLETPTGVAAVRGTQFYGKFDEIFTISVIEGIVELFNDYGSILVNPGETGECGEDSAPTSRETREGDFDPTLGETGDIGEQNTLEIEFENQDGSKRTVRVLLNSRGNEQ